MLSMNLLGELSFSVDGAAVKPLRSRTATALLIYLACEQRPFSRDYLATFFWEDRNETQAAANLRTALKLLRRPFASYLTITRQTVAFNNESPHEIDALNFSCLIENLPAHQPPTPETIDQLGHALDRYQGDFLQGFLIPNASGFEEWQSGQQNRFRRLAERGLFQLTEHFLANGRYQQGIEQAARLLSLNPLHEAAQRHMMELLWRSGQRNAALQQYRTLTQLLAKELDVLPTTKTSALLARIRTAPHRIRPNLPPQPNKLVGREQELQTLYDNLHTAAYRLVTILGPGGVGKTRLLVELGNKIAQSFPGRFSDGVQFIPLGNLNTPQFLLSAIGISLNVMFSGGRPALHELIDFLREKELLLLLDNIEHLLEPAQEVDTCLNVINTILQEAPLVKIAVTSRIRLQLQEEWVFDLPGLASPPPDWNQEVEKAKLETAVTFPAVELFLQSASRIQRDFAPSNEDLHHVVNICRLLDGLPLTIEMAASWIRQLSCAAILLQIQTNLDFLSTSMRNVPDRHRTLRAVFDYSWQMLPAEEATAMRYLSVFQGTITLRAAQEIADCSPQVVAALADKSLLKRSDPENGPPVFELHAMLRQYAALQLDNYPAEHRQAKAKHGAFYMAFLQERATEVKSGAQTAAYDEIAAAIDEIRAAWDHVLETQALEDSSKAVETLFYFYWARGWLQEGLDTAERTAVAAQKLLPKSKQLYDLAQVWQAEFNGWLGRYEEASVLYKQVIARCSQSATAPELVFALIGLGRIQYWQGDYTTAVTTFEESLARARHLEDGYWISLSLNSLANTLADATMDYARAWTLYEESLTISQEVGDQFGCARALINMGAIAQEQQRLSEATQLYQESLDLYRKIQYKHGISKALNYLGQTAYLSGDLAKAKSLIEESYDLNRRAGNRRAMADSLKQLGNVAREAGDTQTAMTHYREAIRVARDIAAEQIVLAILMDTAVALQKNGEAQKALLLFSFVTTYPTTGEELAQAAHKKLVNQSEPQREALYLEAETISLEAAEQLAFGVSTNLMRTA